ncbi:MAG: RNA polymerase sigma factor [Planctomycetota bacterium]
MTDRELLTAYVMHGDEKSLGTFMGRYQDSMFRFVSRLLGDPNAAQDVVQQAFVQVIRHPKRLLSVDCCHNWLLRVARNLGVDHLRRTARQRRVTETLQTLTPAATDKEPAHEAAVEQRELLDLVYCEIERLSPRHRELLLLRVQEKKTYREIAEITGLSATNVGFLLHQAMKTMTQRLRGVGEARPRPEERSPNDE